MNSRPLTLLALAALPIALFADPAPEPPVPVYQAPPRDTPPPADNAEKSSSGQKLYGPSSTLIAPDKAKQVVEAFRAANDKLGKPRYLVYVNRQLVDETSGLRITGRKERTESVQGETRSNFEVDPNAPKPAAPASGAPQTQVNVSIGNNTSGDTATTPGKGATSGTGTKVTAENTYTYRDKDNPSLVDQRTVREIERLFGRPLRAGGAKLADQRVAEQLIADRPIDHFTTATNEAARKDREALAKVADVAIEILVGTKTLTVRKISGDVLATAPDIQVTAIRLSDSAIIGQASSSDVLGRDQQAGRIVRQFTPADIAEATALALMEDIAITNN